MKNLINSFFLGTCKFNVRTVSSTTLINRLKQFNIFRITLTEHGFNFCCLLKYQSHVCGLLLGQDFESVKEVNIFDFFELFKTRFTIFLCIFCCTVGMIAVGSKTLVIKINGVSGVEYVQVKNYVQKNKTMDLEQLEFAVVNEFDYISLASCMTVGNTLVVNVKQRAVVTVDVRPTSVISVYGGVVSKVIVVAGTPLVKVGSVVVVGDVLIANYEEQVNNRIEVKAVGEVWGTVYITATKTVAPKDESELQYIRGEVLKQARAGLLGKEESISENLFVKDLGNGNYNVEAVVTVLRKISS